jgi:hypothetical protein
MIAKYDTVSASPHQVYTTLGSETVVLEFQVGSYFGMNEVGTAVWNFLQQSRQVADVIEYVVNNYEVSAVVAEAEILGFLQNLVEKGLVVVEKTCVR